MHQVFVHNTPPPPPVSLMTLHGAAVAIDDTDRWHNVMEGLIQMLSFLMLLSKMICLSLSCLLSFFKNEKTGKLLLGYNTTANQCISNIIILEIGTNNHCDPCLHPATVGSAVDEACRFFINFFSVKHNVVSQILHRNTPPFIGFNAWVDARAEYVSPGCHQ